MTSAQQAGMQCRYILGAMTSGQIEHIVRLMGMPEEMARMPEIRDKLRLANARMQALMQAEAGLPDRIRTAEPPPEMLERIAAIRTDPLFMATFGDEITQIRMVELDQLVAPQREVNLDHAQGLLERFVADPSPNALPDFCLGTRPNSTEIRSLQNSPTQMSFSSASMDLRFLGGFPRPLTDDDIRACYVGGQPVLAVTLLVGYGAAPISAWQHGSRVVLANGFHRVYALRKHGVKMAPMVVRPIRNLEAEFPPQYLSQSRDYLFRHPRPALLKDYFDEQLIGDAWIKPRRRTLKLSWSSEDHVVPA